jgi:hypothetical protein
MPPVVTLYRSTASTQGAVLSFNVENLFGRRRAFNQATHRSGTAVSWDGGDREHDAALPVTVGLRDGGDDGLRDRPVEPRW